MEQDNSHTDIDNSVVINTAEQDKMQDISTVSNTYNNSQRQLHWTERQVTSLERQLLLNNCAASANSLMSNWTKVFLCALSVILPGIGQIIGIIAGLILVANDSDSDKRTYGAALLTVSIIVFAIMIIFWFLFALALGPDIYY